MAFVAVAAGVGAIGSIIGGSMAAGAQKDAAGQQAALGRQQIAENRRQYDLSRADLKPYRDAGYTALSRLSMGTQRGHEFDRTFTNADFIKDPGYEFRLAEGQRAQDASAAARGGVLSGGALKALARYNQGEASNEYGAAYDRFNNNLTGRYNRLASLAGVGQTATNTGINAGQNMIANNGAARGQIGDAIGAAGNATSSMYAGIGNTIGQTANNLGSYFANRAPSPNLGSYGSRTSAVDSWSAPVPTYNGPIAI